MHRFKPNSIIKINLTEMAKWMLGESVVYAEHFLKTYLQQKYVLVFSRQGKLYISTERVCIQLGNEIIIMFQRLHSD